MRGSDAIAKPLTLAFVSSAYNEKENLEELQREFRDPFDLHFCMLMADNGSEAGSLAVAEDLRQLDPELAVLANRQNDDAADGWLPAPRLVPQAGRWPLRACAKGAAAPSSALG